MELPHPLDIIRIHPRDPRTIHLRLHHVPLMEDRLHILNPQFMGHLPAEAVPEDMAVHILEVVPVHVMGPLPVEVMADPVHHVMAHPVEVAIAMAHRVAAAEDTEEVMAVPLVHEVVDMEEIVEVAVVEVDEAKPHEMNLEFHMVSRERL